ncbi:MAG: hypothetical protein QGI83_11820 [Candidatus Latescibacteria bacterium]|jgi:hypothetical protein|nr:hypothetical protein [Candidatus Latescibacterota bacterium]
MEKVTMKEIKLEPEIEGLRLDSGPFSLTVAPQLGGKIVSLVNKKTKREFISRTNVAYRPRAYAGSFEDYERDGADECFPSVGACPHPTFPWGGVPVPEHGELWTLPWEHRLDHGRLHMSVRGVRFPYLFERQIGFEMLARKEKPYIRLSYSILNESPYDFPFLYAFHPLFRAETRSRILLPPGTDLVTYSSTEDRLGPPMMRHTWPEVTDVTLDKSYDRSAIRSSRNKEAEKLFTTPLEQGRCALVYPNGEFIGFLFPAKKLPYLGLWVNEGGWNNLHHVALEPSTSQVDRLDVAEGLKACGVVPAKGKFEWDISIIVGKGDELADLLGEF